MAHQDIIYLKPVAGLCNRMRAIDSCVSWAARHSKQVVVFWGRDEYLNCRFSDLFEPAEQYQVIEEAQYLGRKALYPYLPGSCPTSVAKRALYGITKRALAIQTEIWFEELDEAVAPLRPLVEAGQLKSMRAFEDQAYALLSPIVSQLSGKGNAFMCSAWRIVDGQNYKAHFVPVAALREKIAAVCQQFSNTTGVHIRRSDHDLSVKHSTLDKFSQAMQAELDKDEAKTFFLATDCLTTEHALQQLYPGKIISYKKGSYNRNSVQAIKDAVVDLYCLSNTRKILGSFFSSFSQVAAELSGIEEYTVY